MLLGTMFDQAMVRAKRARAREGWSSVIGERHHVGERCYYAPAPHGAERTLRLFITLPLLGGDLFGGAYVKPGGAHSAIYLMPAIDPEPARWLVEVSGEELTAPMIDDLFRATFSDDVDAATRLGPLYGFDLFATPWS